MPHLTTTLLSYHERYDSTGTADLEQRQTTESVEMVSESESESESEESDDDSDSFYFDDYDDYMDYKNEMTGWRELPQDTLEYVKGDDLYDDSDREDERVHVSHGQENHKERGRDKVNENRRANRGREVDVERERTSIAEADAKEHQNMVDKSSAFEERDIDAKVFLGGLERRRDDDSEEEEEEEREFKRQRDYAVEDENPFGKRDNDSKIGQGSSKRRRDSDSSDERESKRHRDLASEARVGTNIGVVMEFFREASSQSRDEFAERAEFLGRYVDLRGRSSSFGQRDNVVKVQNVLKRGRGEGDKEENARAPKRVRDIAEGN